MDRYSSYHYDDTAMERLEVLANWLSVECRQPKLLGIIRTILDSTPKPRRKELWSAQLVANYLTRKVLAKEHVIAEEEIQVSAFADLESDFPLAIAIHSLPILSDLTDAWHPEIAGSKLAPVNDPLELERCASIIRRALQLIALDSTSQSLVTNHCAAICIITATPGLQEGQCVSLCSRTTPGIIYISAAPAILTAESIVHESAHQMLYAIAENYQLFIDENIKIKTPLRSDLRPVSGLLHQLWVLHHLVVFYRSLLTASEDLIERNRQKIEKRLKQHIDDLTSGCTVLEGYAHTLTAEGTQLFSEIRLAGA